MYFYVDDAQRARISGTKNDWANRTFAITGTGTHTLRWVYHKDPYLSVDADAAWLDQVTWISGTNTLLTLNPATQQVPATNGTFALTANANTAWDVTSNAAWLTIVPTSGSAAATLTATYSANTATSTRTARITITGGGTTATCTVTQAAATTSGSNNNGGTNTGGNSGGGGGGAPSLWSLLALAILLGLHSAKRKN